MSAGVPACIAAARFGEIAAVLAETLRRGLPFSSRCSAAASSASPAVVCHALLPVFPGLGGGRFLFGMLLGCILAADTAVARARAGTAAAAAGQASAFSSFIATASPSGL